MNKKYVITGLIIILLGIGIAIFLEIREGNEKVSEKWTSESKSEMPIYKNVPYKGILGVMNVDHIESNDKMNIYLISKNESLAITEEVKNFVNEIKSESFKDAHDNIFFEEIYYDYHPEKFEVFLEKYGLMNFPVFLITDDEGNPSYISDANPMDIRKL